MDKNLIFFYLIGLCSVLSISFAIYYISARYKSKWVTWFMYPLAFLSIYILFSQLLKYHSMHFYVDFSHWTQILYSIITTGKPINLSVELMVPGTLNYFSVHFTPLLYLLAVPFKLWPYSETLIIMNYLLMASSVVPLYKLALASQKKKPFGLFMVVLLLWYPTFQYIILYEFEMLRFSIPIILWMLYFWEKRNLIGYFILVFLAVFVREEVGLTITMFGVYVLLFEKKRIVGGATILIGLTIFATITQMVMPFFRAESDFEHIATSLFSTFGNTPAEIIKTVFSRPWLVLSTIFQPIKIANVFILFLPLLFVPLLAPLVLIGTLANFGVVLLSKSVTHSSYMLYYISPSIPFIFYAFIKGWPKLLALLEKLEKKRTGKQTGNIESRAIAAVMAGLLVANVFFGPSPISLQFWSRNLRPAPFRTHNYHYSAYKVTEHHRKVQDFVKLIPDSSIVSAEQFLAPRLYKKRGTMVFPQLKSIDGKLQADYVFIDKENPVKTGVGVVPGSWDGLRENPQYYYDFVEKHPGKWQLVKAGDGYFLYKRIQSLTE